MRFHQRFADLSDSACARQRRLRNATPAVGATPGTAINPSRRAERRNTGAFVGQRHGRARRVLALCDVRWIGV